jgi:hypothetical protein
MMIGWNIKNRIFKKLERDKKRFGDMKNIQHNSHDYFQSTMWE